ncbi:hypothetical protein BY458DRAFT_521241 [Sporodiniella umbellata]|nr:hypothetical protein BY458DRAFT_521241 [Sporodiniella umbellata]
MKLSTLPLAYCAALILLVSESQARVQDGSMTDDLSQWTKDQAQAYLDKYHIAYDKNTQDQTLLDTVKKYRDAAVANTNVFINNKTDVINKMVDAVKLKLLSSYKVSTENANQLANEIQHGLKQLELSGSLTGDKVKQALDRWGHQAVKQKILTEAQFKELALDVQGHFTSPSWYQRLLGSVPSTSDLFPEDAYHTWLKSTITERLQQNKELTEDQINKVIESLKKSISSSSTANLSKLGDVSWWQSFSNQVSHDAKLTTEQASQVAESIKDDVNAYKIFAMDYASETAQETGNAFYRAGQYVYNSGYQLYQAYIAKPLDTKSSQVQRAATQATDAAYQTASILRNQASQASQDAGNSIGQYWRQKELDSYRQLGYTEAHIDWIQNYLQKTFQTKKDWTKESITEGIRTLRQYLIQAKVQTTAHIDAQLKSVEELVHYWTRRAHDEL